MVGLKKVAKSPFSEESRRTQNIKDINFTANGADLYKGNLT